jgi:DNA repair protein RecO (recombination protein O)
MTTSTPRVYRTEAIVLKGLDFGEADRILTLVTSSRGKMRVMAKGIRRTRSRMSGHLDLFTRSALQMARGRNMDIVTQAEIIDVFADLRTDLWRSNWAHYVADLVERFTAEEQANQAIYSLAVRTFTRVAQSALPDLAVRAFELELLSLAGYRPQLYRCIHCQAEVQQTEYRFSARLGGALCPKCAEADPAATLLSIAALKLLRNLQTNADAILALQAVSDQARHEVEQHLKGYIEQRLEARPKSVAVLERLKSQKELS